MIRTHADAAARLVRLEREDKRLYARMHADRLRRNMIQDEILALRQSLTQEQRERYEAMRWMEERG